MVENSIKSLLKLKNSMYHFISIPLLRHWISSNDSSLAGTYDQPQTAGRFSTNSCGWHVDVGTHILRLYSAGVFD